jgi:SAM-dependent methyltransferase
MANPWALLPAAAYEAWLGALAAPLSAIFGRVYAARRPKRLLLPGVGTGAGLEHVDPAVTRRTLGLDPNLSYLAVARQRHLRLGPALELLCGEAERAPLPEAAFDLVHASLVLEWTDLRAVVPRLARAVAPGGAFAAVIDLDGRALTAPARPGAPAGSAPPSPPGAAAAVAAVARAGRPVAPDELRGLAAAAGLRERRAYVVPVAGGARLFAALWAAPK